MKKTWPWVIFLGVVAAHADPHMCWALFSRQQLFWPSLDSLQQSHAADSTIRVGVLPVYAAQYSESTPCDSCHRLSQDGMEFFLGNALTRTLAQMLPGHTVELVDPFSKLLNARKVAFPQILDSLELPWQKWLADCGDPLIYRPQEFMARPQDKARLERAAGALGLPYIFVVRDFTVAVSPKGRSTHFGGLRWSWKGALFNVRAGRFEWAVGFSEDRGLMDLDEDLEPGFAKAFDAAVQKIPVDLQTLLSREPR